MNGLKSGFDHSHAALEPCARVVSGTEIVRTEHIIARRRTGGNRNLPLHQAISPTAPARAAWLVASLRENGAPMAPRELTQFAARQAYSQSNLYRARRKLDLQIVDTRGKWSPRNRWTLPDHARTPSRSAGRSTAARYPVNSLLCHKAGGCFRSPSPKQCQR